MTKIYLIGIPGCGKTTLGKRAATLLSLPFFDTDQMAVSKIGGIEPLDPFRPKFHQQMYYAQIESISEIAAMDDTAIIATGAEVALIPSCVKDMKSSGIIILLDRKPELAKRDISNTQGPRWVMVGTDNNPDRSLSELATEEYFRDIHAYRSLCDYKIENNGTEDEGTAQLTDIIRREIDLRK